MMSTIEMLILSACILLGSLSRASVGAGLFSRWLTYPLAAAICAYAGLTPILDLTTLDGGLVSYLWVVLIASLSLGLGYTQWESGAWMALRFGLPALVLTGPLALQYTSGVACLLYALLSVCAGLLYPHRQKLFERLGFSNRSLGILGHRIDWDSARFAELWTGAAILGGLLLL